MERIKLRAEYKKATGSPIYSQHGNHFKKSYVHHIETELLRARKEVSETREQMNASAIYYDGHESMMQSLKKELAQANKQNKEWKEQNEGLYLLYTKKVLELAQKR